MRDKIRQRGDSKHTGLKPPLERNKRYLWTSLAAIFIILAAVCLLSIGPAMGLDIAASSSGVWTKVDGGSGVTGTGTKEVRWGTPSTSMGQKSGLRFDGQSVASSFGQEFCLGKLTHFNWPILSGSAAKGATLKIEMKFTNPTLGSVYFTYDMDIDETPNTGTCDKCQYQPCDEPCPDKISWPSVPPADQNFELNGDTYTLQIVGIKDSCSGGNLLPNFITQEKKDNAGYLVGRIVLTSRPDAIDDKYETKTNVPLTVPAPGVLWNDFDRGGLPLTVTEYTQPANGQVVINKNDGSFTYTPNQDFCGTDTFTYTITNGKPGKFDTATVTIKVVCDDGNKCTIDKCVNGVCTHTPVNCDDGNSCTDDSCDPATGNCIHTANDNNACSDGDLCTEDFCFEGECVSSAIIYDDKDICNGLEACDPETGKMIYKELPLDCDDGIFCNGAETCDPALGCMPGTAPDCSDGIDCTIDSCNEETDKCENNPDDDFCNDGKFCNGDETCDPAKGCMPGTPPDCSDGIDCTIDSCNEETDKCENNPDDDFCNDGKFCNGDETCDPAKGCMPGTPP
ncbi:choice-of-anchor K domain-containing protein, partial [Methanothrix sp.]|uniref:choice-of-anchor K domain-containing protein n=1 Tax=Methanothrix sp. TaxID=90426 RepID=UPI0032AF2FE0